MNLKSENLDIAVLPYWMLQESRSKNLVAHLIKPKKIIATHIPPGFSSAEKKEIRANYPEITIFTELNEVVEYQ